MQSTTTTNHPISDTHKPDEKQLIVHCTIFANPEPTIRWFKDKFPLNLFSLDRYTIFNHPDDLHEHTIASLIVQSPSFLDNGDFIVEVENEMGFERRVLNVQFQTEEEYNALYFQRYLEHKENLKYHQYRPGEQRWEDIVPEVKDFVMWEPPEEEEEKEKAKKGKRRKKKRYITKTIMTPWGDEKQVEVTDDECSGDSCYDDEEEEEEEQEEEEEEASSLGWNVSGEVGGSTHEDTPASTVEPSLYGDTVPMQELPPQVEEPEVPPVEEQPPPAEEVIVKEPSPEPAVEPIDEQPPQETEVAVEGENQEEAYGFDAEVEDNISQVEEYQPSEPYVRKEPEVEHPIILRRPKFYITDFQLRKKFFFVNKLYDIELLKGKTLRLESLSSSIGKVTCEWRHNGRLIKAPTARKTIEFYSIRNQSVLEIENTRVLDSGTYTVTVYNDYTEPLIDSCKVLITVPKPKETADQPPYITRLLTGINHYRMIKL